MATASLNKTKIFLRMIKFEHTIFALPFAFLAMLLGSLIAYGQFPSLLQWLWVTLAMVGARSAAMSLNRVIDAKFDRENPRTANREIPAGLLSKADVWIFIVASFALLFLAASQLNILSVYLLPIAVFFLVFYSYTKRFTWACHLILGITIGIAPLGGWVAVTGQLPLASFCLFLAVMFWLAGFDTVYATQDAEYDQTHGLHSIPSRFGIKKALWIARCFHVVSFAFFVGLYFLTPLTWIYLVGVALSGMIMVYQHLIVSEKDLSKVQLAFFPMNGTLSVVMFLFAFADMLVIRFY
ncbi:UbiA-like polyprenyltransferase [Shouchella clausii]|uniref:4-hydroxybenzoate polyprenyltransferase n=3 Tax=Shouchella TaxID=2893057 RepID=Q5WGT3_SHOC1|nr:MULTISPECIES: UbiA-like polyprenyltransferase [Shouchella]MCM3312662.1 putative 4-hydroxybenzoate polyprenyltransferase [Psychrobacillus sp. MER TA 17]ALA50926.1 Menaquinone via futalosine polyprenyltransferase [Shouchella clausii]KKI85734.1 prenyltransferase [Shouchella clausii]MBU3231732.1 putative 4-hydroxybenzoate polyprenyltransferase [Shouchella clausii]MBU3264984.1 putative 4-hydroxybenzoate polyprenyltransferase [Shouchella clausii]